MNLQLKLHIEPESEPFAAPHAGLNFSQPPWRHPEANRQFSHGRVTVAYALERSSRRTIGILVGLQGVVVRAPRWVSVAQIEQFVAEKATWIVRKCGEQVLRAEQKPQAMVWQAGMHWLYLGRAHEIEVVQASSEMLPQSEAAAPLEQTAPESEPACWRMALADPLNAEQLRQAVIARTQALGLPYLEQRLAHHAPLLNVQWQRLRLSNARSRWGCAHTNGTIDLSWRLMQLPPALIDYVVVHELAHLRVMNHSPAFWQVVESAMPDYRSRRLSLRKVHLPVL